MTREREALTNAIDKYNAAHPRSPTSWKELSKAVGKNHAYLQQYFKRHVPLVLPPEVRRQLWQILEIDADAPVVDDPIRAIGKPSGFAIRRDSHEVPYLGQNDLPIVGRARAATDDALVLEGGMVGRTERPSYLVGVEDAFSIYVHGDSMVPRFKHGELAYVHPHKPPVCGDDVLVEFEDGTGIVKELVRRTKANVVVLQHNPRKEITLDLRKIKRIVKIEGSRFR